MKDSKIMSDLIEALGVTANSLAKSIDVTPGTIYHVLNDLNKISINLSLRIIKEFPQVNYNYLTEGELPILNEQKKITSMENILGVKVKKPGFDDVPILLMNMNKKLDTLIDIFTKKAEQ